MMNINKDAVRKRIMDIRHDMNTIMSSIEINYDETNDTLWCAKVIKNIAHLVTLSSVLLTQLEMEKDGLMAVLQKHMEHNGIDREETEDLKITIRKNPPRLIIENEERIDKDYYYDKPQLDKQLITKHLKDGMIVPGCKLVQDQRVDIKYKSVNSKEHV